MKGILIVSLSLSHKCILLLYTSLADRLALLLLFIEISLIIVQWVLRRDLTLLFLACIFLNFLVEGSTGGADLRVVWGVTLALDVFDYFLCF